METRIQKDWHLLALCLGAMTLGACSPAPVERVPDPPPPTPVAALTPHPAASAQERAVQLYPELAVKGSLFNRTFLELVEQTRSTNPRVLTMVDWPISIARQTGDMLGVKAMLERATVTPAPYLPKLGTSLDKGAYDQRRNVPKTPVSTPLYSR